MTGVVTGMTRMTGIVCITGAFRAKQGNMPFCVKPKMREKKIKFLLPVDCSLAFPTSAT